MLISLSQLLHCAHFSLALCIFLMIVNMGALSPLFVRCCSVPILFFFQKSQCNRIRGEEQSTEGNKGCRLGGEGRGKEGNSFREQMGEEL